MLNKLNEKKKYEVEYVNDDKDYIFISPQDNVNDDLVII